MTHRVPPDVPAPLKDVEPRLVEWLKDMRRAVFGIMRGDVNQQAAQILTLTPSATTTTLSEHRISGETVLLLQPLTANAAAALATTWMSVPTKGSVVINHANSAQVDRKFLAVITG
jgi:hypothetical protein